MKQHVPMLANSNPFKLFPWLSINCTVHRSKMSFNLALNRSNLAFVCPWPQHTCQYHAQGVAGRAGDSPEPSPQLFSAGRQWDIRWIHLLRNLPSTKFWTVPLKAAYWSAHTRWVTLTLSRKCKMVRGSGIYLHSIMCKNLSFLHIASTISLSPSSMRDAPIF